MKKLLVIGGTGFIGYHIIKEAKKRNYSTYSISLKNPQKKRFHLKVNYIKADISKYNQLKKKLGKKYDYVVNAGGYGINPKHGKEGEKLIRSHYLGLQNILKILNLKKIKKFVQIGSSSEYGKVSSPIKETATCKPKTPYSIAKFLCTQHLVNLYLKSNFPVTIFRLFQAYGSKQDENRVIPFIINNCLKNKTFSTTEGSQICDFCYIDDIVKVIFKSFKNKKTNGEIINIGSGQPIQLKRIFKHIIKKIGKGKPKIGGLNYEKEKNKISFPSIAKAKKLLKWKPNTTFEKGINNTIKSYNE